MRTIRVVSNIAQLGNALSPDFHVVFGLMPDASAGWRHHCRAFIEACSADYIVLEGDQRTLFKLAMIKWLVPFLRFRLISVDTILNAHQGIVGNIVRWIKVVLLKKVNRHLMYFRDTEATCRYYQIPDERIQYIPFKVNQLEEYLQTPVTDGGYIFTGGVSHRDYDTLIAAIQDLPYPVKIMAGTPQALRRNGSRLDTTQLGPQMELITDYDPIRFSHQIAAARLVVLPLSPDFLGAVGLSVYLEAMASRKCVIITDGPAVRGLLSPEMAIAVPPRDPIALREAIERAYQDDEYRQSFADAGHAYAMQLGDDKRLIQSIADKIFEDASGTGTANSAITRPSEAPSSRPNIDKTHLERESVRSHHDQ